MQFDKHGPQHDSAPRCVNSFEFPVLAKINERVINIHQVIVDYWRHMATQIWMPDGTKPLHKPILTNHQWGLVAFTRIMPKISVLDMSLKITHLISLPHLPGASELRIASITKQNIWSSLVTDWNNATRVAEWMKQLANLRKLQCFWFNRQVEIKPDYQLNCR